jgi:DUF971 family protein
MVMAPTCRCSSRTHHIHQRDSSVSIEARVGVALQWFRDCGRMDVFLQRLKFQYLSMFHLVAIFHDDHESMVFSWSWLWRESVQNCFDRLWYSKYANFSFPFREERIHRKDTDILHNFLLNSYIYWYHPEKRDESHELMRNREGIRSSWFFQLQMLKNGSSLHMA